MDHGQGAQSAASQLEDRYKDQYRHRNDDPRDADRARSQSPVIQTMPRRLKSPNRRLSTEEAMAQAKRAQEYLKKAKSGSPAGGAAYSAQQYLPGTLNPLNPQLGYGTPHSTFNGTGEQGTGHAFGRNSILDTSQGSRSLLTDSSEEDEDEDEDEEMMDAWANQHSEDEPNAEPKPAVEEEVDGEVEGEVKGEVKGEVEGEVEGQLEEEDEEEVDPEVDQNVEDDADSDADAGDEGVEPDDEVEDDADANSEEFEPDQSTESDSNNDADPAADSDIEDEAEPELAEPEQESDIEPQPQLQVAKKTNFCFDEVLVGIELPSLHASLGNLQLEILLSGGILETPERKWRSYFELMNAISLDEGFLALAQSAHLIPGVHIIRAMFFHLPDAAAARFVSDDMTYHLVLGEIICLARQNLFDVNRLRITLQFQVR